MDVPQVSRKQATVEEKGKMVPKGEENEGKKEDNGKPIEDLMQEDTEVSSTDSTLGNLSVPDPSRLNQELSRELDDFLQSPMTFEMALDRYETVYWDRWYWHEVESLPIFGPQGIPETCRPELPIIHSVSCLILPYLHLRLNRKWGLKDMGQWKRER